MTAKKTVRRVEAGRSCRSESGRRGGTVTSKKFKKHRKFVKDVAALEFEPMDFGDLTQFNGEMFRLIGRSVRIAAVLLKETKAKMAANRRIARTRCLVPVAQRA